MKLGVFVYTTVSPDGHGVYFLLVNLGDLNGKNIVSIMNAEYRVYF